MVVLTESNVIFVISNTTWMNRFKITSRGDQRRYC